MKSKKRFSSHAIDAVAIAYTAARKIDAQKRQRTVQNY
jgi:Holliday junction resolvasome RuvABC endonuclease subunit